MRLSDIIEAIENALDYSGGMTLEQFVADRKTIRFAPLIHALAVTVEPLKFSPA
jgi:uncharacterized protein with HEPN domain